MLLRELYNTDIEEKQIWGRTGKKVVTSENYLPATKKSKGLKRGKGK
jgi:hypothetical protein